MEKKPLTFHANQSLFSVEKQENSIINLSSDEFAHIAVKSYQSSLWNLGTKITVSATLFTHRTTIHIRLVKCRRLFRWKKKIKRHLNIWAETSGNVPTYIYVCAQRGFRSATFQIFIFFGFLCSPVLVAFEQVWEYIVSFVIHTYGSSYFEWLLIIL